MIKIIKKPGVSFDNRAFSPPSFSPEIRTDLPLIFLFLFLFLFLLLFFQLSFRDIKPDTISAGFEIILIIEIINLRNYILIIS